MFYFFFIYQSVHIFSGGGGGAEGCPGPAGLPLVWRSLSLKAGGSVYHNLVLKMISKSLYCKIQTVDKNLFHSSNSNETVQKYKFETFLFKN